MVVMKYEWVIWQVCWERMAMMWFLVGDWGISMCMSLVMFTVFLKSAMSDSFVPKVAAYFRIFTIFLLMIIKKIQFQVHQEDGAQRRQTDFWIWRTVSTFYLVMTVTFYSLRDHFV